MRKKLQTSSDRFSGFYDVSEETNWTDESCGKGDLVELYLTRAVLPYSSSRSKEGTLRETCSFVSLAFFAISILFGVFYVAFKKVNQNK